jgi:hypothetical protein
MTADHFSVTKSGPEAATKKPEGKIRISSQRSKDQGVFQLKGFDVQLFVHRALNNFGRKKFPPGGYCGVSI